MEIHPIDKGNESAIECFNGQEVSTQGYVELVWRFQQSRDNFYTRFIVTTTYDPPFDAVLGRKSSGRNERWTKHSVRG